MRACGFLLLLSLMVGCVGVGARTCPPGGMHCLEDQGGGVGVSSKEPWAPPDRSDSRWREPDDEERRQAERAAAVAQMWGVASASDREGARIELKLWACNGALTLESTKSTVPARPREPRTGEQSFKQRLGTELPLLSGPDPGAIQLILVRERGGWALENARRDDETQVPPEARTLPVMQPPVPAAAWETTLKVAEELVHNLREPGELHAEHLLTVELEDERIRGISTLDWKPRGALTTAAPEETLAWEVANQLLPYTQGQGNRKVLLVLRAERLPGQSRLRWRVAATSTVHPPPPTLSDAEGLTIAEYRRIHEETLRRWREDTRHYAEVGAKLTAREVAIWIASGWALHAAGSVVEVVSSPVLRILRRGGPWAADWLESLLVRVPEAERGPIRELWARVDLEGRESLTAAEQDRLRALVARFEEVASKPLTDDEKTALRSIARERFWSIIDPKLAAELVTKKGYNYEVHHLIPLEYAELFVEMDINSVENLAAVDPKVHQSIGRIWTVLRTRYPHVTAADVRRVAEIINQHYSRWYNTVYNPATSVAQLQTAESSTLTALHALFR